MKTEVDQELCISCGACVSVSPEIYDWNGDEKAEAKNGGNVPEGMEDEAQEAADGCPTEAIKIN
ncbi:MAG TPA: ferredoxin [Bacillota bacterium]|nr:ferredoxin [Bacillota bacterium]